MGETLQDIPLDGHQEQAEERIPEPLMVERSLQRPREPPDGAKAKSSHQSPVEQSFRDKFPDFRFLAGTHGVR
jgi:hypothetical protein